MLSGSERADWLTRFDGDAERLDLALIQAAAFVQPNSSRPLIVQVRAQLARTAGDRRDRNRRVQNAGERFNYAKTTAQLKAEGARRFLETIGLGSEIPQP